MNKDTQNTDESNQTTNPSQISSKLVVDPIAQAILQMEEAARVLSKSAYGTLGGYKLIVWLKEQGTLFQGGQTSNSLAKALGYKSPQQEREEKIREAEQLEADVTDLMLQADKLSKKAEKLREEAGL